MLKTYPANVHLTGLSDDRDGNQTVYNTGVMYICSECGTSASFDVRKKSNNESRAAHFSEVMGGLTAYEQDYCDFDCPGCGAHVRMVYDLTEVSMAHYEYYPRMLYVRPASTGFAMEVEKPVVSKRPAWLSWLLGSALLVFAFLLLR